MRNLIKWLLHFNKKRTHNAKPVKDMRRYKLNIHQDPLDERDYVKAVKPEIMLPRVIDYSQYVTVKDQGNLGACGSFAACSGLEMIDQLNNVRWPTGLSELFHYWEVRQPKFFNTFPQDSGQDGRDAMAVMYKLGICPDPLDPYNPGNYNHTPGTWCGVFSRFWKIKSYARCTTIEQIKAALADKDGVWLGIPVQDGIFGNKGEILTWQQGVPSIGGHAICVCGYNEDNRTIKIVNSWNTRWGLGGFGLISYDYLTAAPWMDCWSFSL